MKKVILRLIVAGILLALIVLVLMLTVFKTPATMQAYQTIDKALASQGQITTLSKGLNDDLPEFTAKYGKMVEIYQNELDTLNITYVKLYYMRDVNDEKMTTVSTVMEELTNALNNANNQIKNLKDLKQSSGTVIEINSYIETIKEHVVNALTKISQVNNIISDSLLKYYYKENYSETLFLNKLKSVIAKEYYTFGAEDPNSMEAISAYNFYKFLLNKGHNFVQASDIKECYIMLESAKKVNLERLVCDFKDYAKEYELKDDEQNEEKTNMLKSIDVVMDYINSIADGDIADFTIRNSVGFVSPVSAVKNI